MAAQADRKYCSDKCTMRDHRAQTKIWYSRICACDGCSESITTTDQRKIYCSDLCRRRTCYDANSDRYRYADRVTGKSYPYKREWAVKSRIKSRQQAIDSLGGVCSQCGFSDIRALQVDHVNGDGHLERANAKNSLWTRVKAYPEKFQLLCANCNWIKRIVQCEGHPTRDNPSKNALCNRLYRSRLKLKAYNLLGNVCKVCGIANSSCLQVDHILGDGYKQRASGLNLYQEVLAHPELHQILCANCNWIKRAENKEYRGRPFKYQVAQ